MKIKNMMFDFKKNQHPAILQHGFYNKGFYMKHKLWKYSFYLLACLSLSACGQTGPLYLPHSQAAKTQARYHEHYLMAPTANRRHHQR